MVLWNAPAHEHRHIPVLDKSWQDLTRMTSALPTGLWLKPIGYFTQPPPSPTSLRRACRAADLSPPPPDSEPEVSAPPLGHRHHSPVIETLTPGAARGGVSSLWQICDLPRFSTRCTVAPLMVKSVGRDGSCRSLNRNVTRCRVSSAKCNRYARAMALGPSGQASGRQCRSRLRTTWADSPTRLNYVFPAGRGLTTSSPFCVNFQIPLLLTIFSMEDALPSPPPLLCPKTLGRFS